MMTPPDRFIFGKSIAAAEMNDDNGALDVYLQELLQVFRDVFPSSRRPHQPPAPVDTAGFTDNGGRRCFKVLQGAAHRCWPSSEVA